MQWMTMNDSIAIVLFFLLFGEFSIAFVVALALYALEQEEREEWSVSLKLWEINCSFGPFFLEILLILILFINILN